MFSRAISALIFAVVLLVSTGAPAIAYVGGATGTHALEHVDEHAQEAAFGGNDQSHEPGDAPFHAAPHHHCAADVTPTVAPIVDTFSGLGQAVHPALVTILHSRALAPPTQPPAA